MKNKIKEEFLTIRNLLLPENFHEKAVATGLLVYFAVFFLLLLTIDLPHQEWLGMMGFDTLGHVTYPPQMLCLDNALNWNIRHPLYTLFYLPVILVNEGLLFLGVNLSWPLFLLTSTFMMSFSGLFIYKSLKALGLGSMPALAILTLYCSFAYSIFLSVQVDSFVMTTFLLSFMLLLFVRRHHSIVTDNLLFLGITGTTSTNFVKFAFYQLVEERSLKAAFWRFIRSIAFFCVLFLATVPDLCIRLIERPRGLLYAFVGDSFYYQGFELSKLEMLIDNFLSEPILFHNATGLFFSHETTHLPAYPSPLFYLPAAIIFTLLILSVFLNRRQPLIWLFCCCFSEDLLIHFVMEYGMSEAQLFCGHWLFFVPIVLGALVARLPKQSQLLSLLFIGCAVFLLSMNIGAFILSLR